MNWSREYHHTLINYIVRAETDDKFNSVAHEKHISAMCSCCIIYIVYGDGDRVNERRKKYCRTLATDTKKYLDPGRRQRHLGSVFLCVLYRYRWIFV